MRIYLSNPLHNVLNMSNYLKQSFSFLTYWPKYVASILTSSAYQLMQ